MISHWEELALVLALARSVVRFSGSVECFVRSKSDKNIRLMDLSDMSLRIFLYGLFLSLLSSSVAPVLLLYRSYPCDILQVSTALFLIILDVDTFFVRVQHFAMCSYFPSSDSRRSFWTSVYWKHPVAIQKYIITIFGFPIEDSINVLIKILLLGVGAASGYIYLESLCAIVLLEQVLYVLLLIVVVPLSVYMLLSSCSLVSGFQTNRPKYNNFRQPIRQMPAGVRVRSKSDSVEESAYPERRHVDVQQLKSIHTESPIQKRIKYITLIGLFVLYLHNRYILGKYGRGQSSAKSIASDAIMDSVHWVLSFLSEHTSLNLFCFLLIGVLLYYRAKVYASQKIEILDLDVKSCDAGDDPLSLAMQPNFYGSNKSSHQNSDSPVSHNLMNDSLPSFDSLPLCRESNTATNKKEDETQLSINQHRAKQITQLTDSDAELLRLLSTGELKTRDLESMVTNPIKAVELRRLDLARLLSNPHVLERLPYKEYDYRCVHGQCCEEVIGYLPIPIGKVGPLLLDGHSHYIPLATTEGCLVASTNRGCRALFLAGGVKSVLFRDQMTRAPVVWFSSVLQVVECISWIESSKGFDTLKAVFEQTSAHIQLISIFPNPSGHYLHIRFAARTGDAMGMNMVSKATNCALRELHRHFPTMQVISLSGNMCTDKKPAAINAILGRGKSVIAEAHLPATVLAQVLHTTAARLARLAHAKNYTGSAMAGCPGMLGSNAHAANIVAGLFAATGQDLAQVVDASACLTQFEVGDNDSLVATVTMPCVEVGTIGGGTRLPAQRSCLELLDLNVDRPTEHLARLIAGTVLAGELSLMAALDTDDLVNAHLRLNRASVKSGMCAPTHPTPSVTSAASKSVSISTRTNVSTVPLAVKSDLSSQVESSHPTM